MPLSIKNEEADRLTDEIRQLTGESKTNVIIESLRQRLQRIKKQNNNKNLEKELLQIGERCAAYGRTDKIDHDELLYDEAGLPK